MNQEGVIFQQPGQKHLQSVSRFTVCVWVSLAGIYTRNTVCESLSGC
jgi:hypothetical protein